jgi:hypothetical protein
MTIVYVNLSKHQALDYFLIDAHSICFHIFYNQGGTILALKVYNTTCPFYFTHNHSFECDCCNFDLHRVDLGGRDSTLLSQMNQIGLKKKLPQGKKQQQRLEGAKQDHNAKL